jgi:AGCS family alanine or glycine:cation symporter
LAFYLLVISKFLPFRYLGHAFQVLRGKYDNPDGEISHFQALSTALAATIGMENIAEVAGLSPAEVTYRILK